MLVRTVRVSDKGQIALPKALRQESGIKEGDVLVALEKDGSILLQKVNKIADAMDDDFADLRKMAEMTMKKFWSSREDEIWDHA